MNKHVSGNYFNYLTILVLSAAFFVIPGTILSQGFLKAQVRNTNCDVAGHQADRWFFGQNAGLDFRPQDPVAVTDNDYLNIPTSPAIMADSNGNILLFSDGLRVFDRIGQVMPNGNGLHGFGGISMPVLIVPKPESDSIYYVFTTYRSRQNVGDTIPPILYGLEYNEVNLNRNGGLGDVTKKNKVLLPPQVSSKLTAVRHSNGTDYWVVAHKFNSSEFCSFRVSPSGVDTGSYVSSVVGTFQTYADTNEGLGYMKISPDGTKIALAIYGLDTYEIFDFDAGSGKVSNAITSSPIFNEAYGIEFSSDSRFLYATTTSTSLPQPNFTPPSYLFQFDVNLGNSIFSSYDTIALDTLGSYFGGIQLASDGRIYVSRSPYGNASLSVIANPKRPGTACNFTANALDLQGKKSRFGFPDFMQSYFDLPHFDVENVCFEDGTIFTLQNNSNIDNVTWQFGDPSGNPNTSTDLQPTHTFSAPGDYQVQVTEFFGGQQFGPYTETVTVNELPPVDIGDTVYMYPGSPIILDAGPGYTTYEWSTGDNSQTVKISEQGTYYVTVQNERCCFKVDSALVIYFDVIVPNAFRPGGTNNVFKAYASSLDAINNFALYVYNRWGQQIFLTNDITQGWDGTVAGTDAPGDVYVWLVNYDVERAGKTVKIAYKGNVLLLR